MNRFRFSALALCALVLTACNEAPAPTPAEPQPSVQGQSLHFPEGHPQLALLRVAAAKPGQSIAVELPAKLVWNEGRTQRIYPAFAGRVTDIRADVGQRVPAGAVLAQLASPDFAAVQADTAKALADAQLTHKALLRQRELHEAGVVARKDLEQAEADDARARAEVARTEARTRLYGSGAAVNQRLALTAGLGGVVVERNINPGQELRPEQYGPGAPVLFVITDPTSLWVQIDARESEVGTLLPGASFALMVPAYPGQVFEGQVTASADAIDPATRTIKVRGVVANPDRRLKAEMLATAHFERTLGAGVVVPAQAVMLRGGGHVVYVQTKPGVFEAREVELGYQGPQEVVVSSGLEVGDQVVAENVLLLARLMADIQSETSAAPVAPEAGASSAVSGGKAASK